MYDIIVTFPVACAAWEDCRTQLKNHRAKYHFYITNDEEYGEATRLIEQDGINDCAIHPVYVQTNLDFFERNVYVHTDDMFRTPLPFRTIFARQKVNTSFFGSLTIETDGQVYANTQGPPLGHITKDTLLELIKKELIINTAWRKTRNMEPCLNCLYQYVCPSPSHYETVLNKPDLCHINHP